MKFISFGSCFSDSIAGRMSLEGEDICVNPYGVLFNPSSIATTILRLSEPEPYDAPDVVERMPAPSQDKEDKRQGRDLGFVSFFHHGKFTCPTPEEFLENANRALAQASAFFAAADTVLVTFGTSWVFRYVGASERYKNVVVANCHKHPSCEFVREFMDEESIVGLWVPIVEASRQPSAAFGKAKRWVFTVSPILHKADGAEGNRVSKSTLVSAEKRLVEMFPENAFYFPSYEIMTEELTDEKWWNEEHLRPSDEAVNVIYERFRAFLSRL